MSGGDVLAGQGAGGCDPGSGQDWSCWCHCRERAEGVRDELAGTQRVLQMAQAQVTVAGSALQSAKDTIRAAESSAREVRSSGAVGTLGRYWGRGTWACWGAGWALGARGEWGQRCGTLWVMG